MLSAAKHLVVRPFASLRVTHKCANLVWFDLGETRKPGGKDWIPACAGMTARAESPFLLPCLAPRAMGDSA
jgi:hypothetical protein